ncbi:MAG: phosphoribosyltransferase [Chitinophagaceae bacterium]|nr:phosphoribosyltransferase [Chitinophagaceae bacterium]MDB5222171.1 phosphoribosyltransferase [Chitinophagaceae bacterium]
MNLKTNILSPLVHLFYPHVCTGCGSDLVEEDNLLCLKCVNDLPHTNFEMHAGNPVEKIFWGRLALTAAMSEFYFAKGTLIQTLIHEFKYKGNTDVGMYLGAMIGSSLLNNNRFTKIDALIPLPLFADKEFKRGYNQATILCNGISEVTNIPVLKNNVVRNRFTQTQTKKHRTERWENVESSFEVKNPNEIKNKHILLVDDVVTTGATLEACGAEILKVQGTRLSIATLAFASK